MNQTKLCIEPIILRTQPLEYGSGDADVESEKVGGHDVATLGTDLLERALTLGVTRDKVTYYGLDVCNLPAPVPPRNGRLLGGSNIYLSSSPRSRVYGSVMPTVGRGSRAATEDGKPETTTAEVVNTAKRQKIFKGGQDYEDDKCKGSLTGRLVSEVSSLPGSCSVTPHPSYFGPLHTASVAISTLDPSLEPLPVNPVTSSPAPFTTTSTSYGKFIPHLQAKKSNLTQAILELHRREWEATCIARESPTASVNAKEENIRHIKITRLLPKPLLRGDGTAVFPPTEARPTTAISYAETHPVAAALDISAVDYLVGTCSATGIPRSVGLPSLLDPSLRSQHQYHSYPKRPHSLPSGYSSRSSLCRKMRVPMATRTVCNTGEEFSHLWRDDLSFVSIERAEDGWEGIFRDQSDSMCPDLCSPKIYSSLDGSLDGLGDCTLDLLLCRKNVTSEPSTVLMYCNGCRNGKGMCFCYYGLRVGELARLGSPHK